MFAVFGQEAKPEGITLGLLDLIFPEGIALPFNLILFPSPRLLCEGLIV